MRMTLPVLVCMEVLEYSDETAASKPPAQPGTPPGGA